MASNDNLVRVTIMVKPQQLERLDAEASRLRVSRSWVFRQIVDQVMGAESIVDVDALTEPRGQS